MCGCHTENVFIFFPQMSRVRWSWISFSFIHQWSMQLDVLVWPNLLVKNVQVLKTMIFFKKLFKSIFKILKCFHKYLIIYSCMHLPNMLSFSFEKKNIQALPFSGQPLYLFISFFFLLSLSLCICFSQSIYLYVYPFYPILCMYIYIYVCLCVCI